MAVRPSLACALVCTLALLACGAHAQRGVLIVLGDSHTDNGNAWRLSNHTIPTPAHGYVNGRYTNGPVWNDYIANATGLSVFNAASPAGTACQPPFELPFPFPVPYLAQQAQAVANASSSLPVNRAVFIWLGTNDIFLAVRGMLSGAFNMTVAESMVPMWAACLKQSAEALVRFGHTRSLVVANVHPMQLEPSWMLAASEIPLADGGAQIKHDMGILARQFNELIRRDIADLAARYKRAKISMFDMAGFWYTTAAEGPSIGITNVTHACNVVPPWTSIAGWPMFNRTSTCDNPDEYMFAFDTHLSTRVHRLLADSIQAHLAAQSPQLFN